MVDSEYTGFEELEKDFIRECEEHGVKLTEELKLSLRGLLEDVRDDGYDHGYEDGIAAAWPPKPPEEA